MSVRRRRSFWVGAGLFVAALLTFDGAFFPTDWTAVPSHFFQFVLRHVSTFDAGDVNFFSNAATFVVYFIPFGFIGGVFERLSQPKGGGGETNTDRMIRRFGRGK